MGDQENKSDRHRGGSPLNACRPFVSRRPFGPAAGKLLCLAAGRRHGRAGGNPTAQREYCRLCASCFHAFRAESHGHSAANSRGFRSVFQVQRPVRRQRARSPGLHRQQGGHLRHRLLDGGRELEEVLEVQPLAKADGILLGKRNGKAVCLPADTRLNRHIAVFGASGTGKSRGFIRPALFNIIRRGESAIITDSKGELYADTAELFRRHGYEVKVFNLVNPEHGDSWNCMSDLGGDTLLAQVLTNVIIGNTSSGKTDHFWDNGEGNLLKALILYVDLDPTRSPEEKNLPAVYEMLIRHSAAQLTALFERLPLDHPARGPYRLFSQASDTVRSGIVLGLGTRLQVLQNERWPASSAAATST